MDGRRDVPGVPQHWALHASRHVHWAKHPDTLASETLADALTDNGADVLRRRKRP